MPTPPIDALVVASWYPSIQDPVAGRFVADQVEALAMTGRVRPVVVSFEPAELIGAGALRDRMATLVGEMAERAVADEDELFARRGFAGPPGVPVARLTIASGRHPSAGSAHGAVARDRALAALAARWQDPRRKADPPVPTLIHAHTVYPDGAGAVTLADALHRPLVLTEHSSFVGRLLSQPAVRERYFDAVGRAARVTVVSHSLANELLSVVPNLETKVVVIPNAVAVDAFTPAPLEARRPGELLFVGYLKETKGIDVLLKAVAAVRAVRPEISLRLIGGSPTAAIAARWENEARELGIADAVRFDGPADRAGVAEAMARASLFVHPSPRETFGVVAAEALASGLPVVATDSGGVTEILGDDPGALGAVVPTGDAAALATAIEATLDRRASFDPLALRRSAVIRFGGASVAARFTDLYESVLGESGPPTRGIANERSSAPGAPRPRPSRWIVVAFDPARAALMDDLPARIRAVSTVVTSAGTSGPNSSGLAGVVVTDLQGRVRATADAAALGARGTIAQRLLRAARNPVAVARRRGWLPGLERLIQTRGTDAIAAVVAQGTPAPGEGADVPVLICVDGLDHLAALPVVAAGQARLAAGGIRHLADRDEGA